MSDKLILRDRLAIDRTVLANERTLLAYIRTCLGFFATGAVLINFTERAALVFLGYISIVVPVFISIFGVYRFMKIRRKIKKIYTNGAGE
jgi:putative membrane protein